MAKNNRTKGGGQSFQPKYGQTKLMFCSNCMKNRNLRQVWHTFKRAMFGNDYWKCNTCGSEN
jgi:hypothetical protein